MTYTVFVAGATGRLGGPLAHQLVARGHRVRAVSRAPASPVARQLQDQGVEITPGDFDDPGTVKDAARGADALFAMSTPHGPGVEAEARHGINLVEAAAEAGVGHVVYSSGASADRDTGVPFYDSKYRVEQHLNALAIPHTVIAPVFYMENVFNPWNVPALQAGGFPSPVPVATPMQQVPVIDAASFAAIVLERPDEFVDTRIDIASDEFSAKDAADVLSRLTGTAVEAQQIPRDELPPPLAALAAWHEHEGYDADVAGLRERYPEVGWHRFEDWARTQDWAVLGTG